LGHSATKKKNVVVYPWITPSREFRPIDKFS